MPLPGNGVLTLQTHSRPEDTGQSKPTKQAMVVRMSAETLELLEASPQQPPMDFQFGENPGVYIGDKFFPMRSLKEDTPHEIYLRASSAAKPMAPLKQYALVTGKFTIERELGEKALQKLRMRTFEAEQERSDRAAKVTNLNSSAFRKDGNTKRKQTALYASMFRNPVQPADHVLLSNTSVPSSRVSTPNPSPPTREDLAPLRKRLIHYLALDQQQNTDDILNAVCDPECAPSVRRDILTLLEDVAEPILPPKKTGDTSVKAWRLKTRTWLEVRPYEWPQLTDQNRTSMARLARLAYNALGIPVKDPAWNHVLYRNPSSGLPATLPAASSSKPGGSLGKSAKVPKAESTKKATSSKEKVTPKASTSKTKGEATPRDEGVKSQPKIVSNVPANNQKGDHEQKASPPLNPTRRLPGSGFKVMKQSQVAPPAVDTTIRKPSTSAGVSSKDKEHPTIPAKSAASTPLPIAQGRKDGQSASGSVVGRIKKVKESSADSDRDLDRAKGKAKEREQGGRSELDRSKARQAKDEGDAVSTTLKRKKVRETDDNGSAKIEASKRRKTDSDLVSSSSKDQDHHSRDLSLPKKPEGPIPLPPKIKNETTPSPMPKRVKQDQPRSLSRPVTKELAQTPPPRPIVPTSLKPSSSSSAHRKESSMDRPMKSNGKRRRSPIYTSSEEEETRPSKPTKREAPTASSSRPSPPPPSHTRSRIQLKDDDNLRDKYKARYPEYLASFQEVIAERCKIEALLKNSKGTEDDDSVTDSDSELLDEDEFEKMTSKHIALKQELEQIRDEHAKKYKAAR